MRVTSGSNRPRNRALPFCSLRGLMLSAKAYRPITTSAGISDSGTNLGRCFSHSDSWYIVESRIPAT